MSTVEYFIGGGGDKGDWISSLVGRSSHIMKYVAEDRDTKYPLLFTEYRGHEEQQKILLEIKEKWQSGTYTSIRLTGHSWGGQAAIKLCKNLMHAQIPVDELITLDPVSLFPCPQVYPKKWVNIYITPSVLDLTIGKIPVVGNIINAIFSLPTLLTKYGGINGGGYIANVGRQLGYRQGAYNMQLNVAHSNAYSMYEQARRIMTDRPDNTLIRHEV